jgi:hypothetical protein
MIANAVAPINTITLAKVMTQLFATSAISVTHKVFIFFILCEGGTEFFFV